MVGRLRLNPHDEGIGPTRHTHTQAAPRRYVARMPYTVPSYCRAFGRFAWFDDAVQPRVSLRPLEPNDRAAYVGWITEPEAARWSPVADPDAEFERAAGSRYNFVVEVDGHPAGAVAVEGDWGRESPQVELGIVIDVGARGAGIGRMAVSLVLDVAFGELGAGLVGHGVYLENEPVCRFFERCGFQEAEQGSGPDGRPGVFFTMDRPTWAAGSR